MLWFQCTLVTRSVSLDAAVIDDLGCRAYSSSTDDVLSPLVIPKDWEKKRLATVKRLNKISVGGRCVQPQVLKLSC